MDVDEVDGCLEHLSYESEIVFEKKREGMDDDDVENILYNTFEFFSCYCLSKLCFCFISFVTFNGCFSLEFASFIQYFWVTD